MKPITKKSPVTRDEVEEIVSTVVAKEVKASEKRLSEKLDEVMGELKSTREEFTLIKGKYDTVNDLEDIVDDHEKRIKKLEHPVL